MQSQSEDPPTWTWPSILTTAKHTPRTTTPNSKPDLPSPEQQSLIDSLRTSPLTNPHPDQDPDQSELKSTIDEILSDYEDESSTPTSTSAGNGAEKEEWQNLHAFLAFITKERIVPLEDVGIHVLRVALERGVEHHYHHQRQRQRHQLGTGVPPGRATGRRKKMAVFVSCAAIWALVMGEELWERRGETSQEFSVGLSLSPRESVAPQDKGKGQAVSKSRWQMWIDRLQFLSLAEDLDIKTRELAAEAAAVMRRVT